MAANKTSLTRKELSAEYNKWIKDNPKQWSLMKKNHRDPFPQLQKLLEPKYGVPYWREKKGDRKITGSMPTKNDPGKEFRIENKGNDVVGFKSKETRSVTRGTENRRASTNEQTLTKKDYRDYAKRNGHSQEKADKLYELNQKRLAALQKQKGKTLKNSGLKINYEHGLPTTSKTYGGVEHWRNLLLMDNKSNSAKSDLMIKPQSAVRAGIPLSKQSALQMDFNNKPAISPKIRREIIKKDLTENNPIKSRTKNKLWNQLRIKRGNGNGNGNGNGKNGNGKNGNGKNGGLKIGAGSSNSFNGNLTKPSLADEAFKHMNLESFHKIRTPLGVMPRA